MQSGTAAGPPPQFVKTIKNSSVTSTVPSTTSSSTNTSSTCLYDVVVAGGTLGIFVATALACQGFHVAVIERGVLAGRTQEWNISRKELQEAVEVRLVEIRTIAMTLTNGLYY